MIGVAAVLQLDALRNQAFAAFLAAAAEDVAAGFGGHAGAETELILAGALGRLVGAFAHGCGLGKGVQVAVRWAARGAHSSWPLTVVNPPIIEN